MDTTLTEITNLLRRYKENIINGSSKLCLTVSLISEINLALQEADYNKAVIISTSTVTDNVKYLCDIIRKIPKLMITQKIGFDKKYRLDISRFGNLNYLELNNIPIHLVDGIQLLKHQLHVLVCNNVSASIDDIFGNSGIWISLHTAKLCYNNFKSLSHQYNISWLQHLDLSYNKLKGKIKMDTLKTLKYLNLSFNRLTSLPVLNKDAYCSLKVIRLSNNFIEDLSSMHLFSGLETLDLSYNLLAHHSVLSSMGFLLNLQNINMSNNPISYHPYYRMHFCNYINGSLNLNDLLLDGKTLSAIEKREVIRLNCFMHETILPKHSTISPCTLNKSVLTSIPKKKVRDAVIGNCFVNTTLPDTNKCNFKNKRDIEEFNESRYRNRFSVNLHSNRRRNIRVRCGMGFNFDSITSMTSFSDLHYHLPDYPPNPESFQLSTCQLDPLGNNTNIEALKEKSTDILFNDENKILYLENLDTLHSQLLAFGIKPQYLNSHIEIKMKENDVNQFDPDATEKLNEDMTIKDDESTSSEETFDELLLAQKKLQDGNFLDVFITLNESNIKEKCSVTGHTLISWSLRSVQSCEKLMTNPSTIRLVFNRIRKVVHERIYVMENPDADKLFKRIRLFLEARSLSSMNQIIYRCLKCTSIFSQEFQQDILFSLKSSDEDILKKKPTIKCRVCGSALVVIEEDVSLSKHKVDNFSIATSLHSDGLYKSSSIKHMSVVESTAEDKTGELILSSSVDDSDIEVISNPSQSSIEVLEVHDQDKVEYLSSTTDELKGSSQINTDSDTGPNAPCNILRSVIFLDSFLSNIRTEINGKDRFDKEDVDTLPKPNTYSSVLEYLIYCATEKFIPGIGQDR